MRIVTLGWDTVWCNTAHSTLPDAIRSAWLRVVHDIIPSRYRLHHIPSTTNWRLSPLSCTWYPTSRLSHVRLLQISGRGHANAWQLTYGTTRTISHQKGWQLQHIPIGPNPNTTLCYESWTSLFITCFAANTDHSHPLRGLYVEDPPETLQLERARKNICQLPTGRAIARAELIWATTCCTRCKNQRRPARHTGQESPTHTRHHHMQDQGREDTSETEDTTSGRPRNRHAKDNVATCNVPHEVRTSIKGGEKNG
jgi:hypothetical protein